MVWCYGQDRQVLFIDKLTANRYKFEMSMDHSPMVSNRQHTVSTAKFSANRSSGKMADTTSFEVSYMEEIQNLIEQVDWEMQSVSKGKSYTFQERRTAESIRFEKNDCLAKIISFQEQITQSRDQIEMVRQDIQSKHFQNYELIIETDELEQVLNSYRTQRPEDADALNKEVQLENQLEEEQEYQQSEKAVFYFYFYFQSLGKLEKRRKQVDLGIEKILGEQERLREEAAGIEGEQHGLQTSETQTKIYELLEFDGYTLWTSILRIFNLEGHGKSESLESTAQVQEIQRILIREVRLIKDGEYSSAVKQQLQEQKKRILFSHSNQLLLSLSMSFDQIIYNIQFFLKSKTAQTQQQILDLVIAQLEELTQNYQLQAEANRKLAAVQKALKQHAEELGELRREQAAVTEELSRCTLHVAQAKKGVAQMQAQLKRVREQMAARLGEDCEKMTAMYLQDKEHMLRDVKFKYGKNYVDRMVADLKSEFRAICQKQQREMHHNIKYILKRVWQIEKITQQNKGYIEMLENDLEQFRNSLTHLPMAVQQLNLQLQHLDKQEQLAHQPASVPSHDASLAKDRFYHLQNLKIALLQMENQMHRKKHMSVPELQSVKQQLRELKKHQPSPAILEHSKEISASEQDDSQLKDTKKKDLKKNSKTLSLHSKKSHSKSFRSPSAQLSVLSNQSPPHRSQSIHYVPQISIELLNDNSIQVNNPRELLDSVDFQSHEPAHTIKKQSANNYHLSFNNNLSDSLMIQQQSCITASVLDMFEDNASQHKASQPHLPNPNQEAILAYFRKTGLPYDPINHIASHPQDFGFTLYKVIPNNNKVSFYCAGHNQENLDQIKLEIPKEDIKQFKLELSTQNALRFQNIYNRGSKRIPCQDSVALNHLKIKYFPFTIIGKDNNILEGLATSEQDLHNLEKLII